VVCLDGSRNRGVVSSFQPVTVGLAEVEDLILDGITEKVLDRSTQIHALQAYPHQITS